MLLLLTSCTSIRPIVKIGVIAPFEGLYRASGYAALEGVRQAVTECAPPGMDVMPLALDDSGDPAQAQRAAEKLLIDPSVAAVIGPFLLDAVPAVSDVILDASSGARPDGAPTWIAPMLIDPASGYGAPTANTWLTAQVDFVASASNATRVLLLGLPAAWDTPTNTHVATERVDDLDTTLATIATGDAILWLGRPDQGAAWQNTIRQRHPSVDFWLAAQAGQDIFAAHTQDQHATHWLHWTQSNYNHWSQPAARAADPTADNVAVNATVLTDAMRELAYYAACDALISLADNPAENLEENADAATHARQPVTVDWELQGHPMRPATQ